MWAVFLLLINALSAVLNASIGNWLWAVIGAAGAIFMLFEIDRLAR